MEPGGRAMTEPELLQQLSGLSLAAPSDHGKQEPGQALLNLLLHRGQPQHNGYQAGSAPGAPAGRQHGAAPPGPAPHPPPQQDGAPAHPDHPISSLFGGTSIWSSGGGGDSGGQAPSALAGGGLWGPGTHPLAAPPPAWPGQLQASSFPQQQQQQQQAPPGFQPLQQGQSQPPPGLPQQQQQQQAPPGFLPLQQGQSQPPPGFPQQQQQQALPGFPPPGFQQPQLGHYQFAPQHHLPPPQHPGLSAHGQLGVPPPHHLLYLQQQQQLDRGPQQLPPHLQHLALQPPPMAAQQQPQQQQPQQQQLQRPVVMPYNPLSALLQPGSMPPVQQQQQQQQMQAAPPVPAPGTQPGAWGNRNHLLASLQQPQQQGGLAQPAGEPAPAPQAGLGLSGGTLQQAAGGNPPSAVSAGSASPPPLPRRGEGEASQAQQQSARADRPAGAARRAGGQAGKAASQAGRENRWVDVMDRSHDGRGPKADMAALDAALRATAESLMPTIEERDTQLEAFAAIRSLLQARYPGARVHLFGSVANGLSVRHNNDIDVCLELDGVDDQAGKSEVAAAVGELMEAAGMDSVLALPKARVPVVKFVVPRTGTKADVTVNNLLACVNTKLLADYCAADARLAPLVALVKHWAKQRAVNDPYRGTLSSYCYVLMCIHLLQTRPTPVLPVLQQLPPTFRRTVGQWTCEFCDDIESLRGFGSANTESLGQLLWAFFEYWAWRHDYAHDVVSVRLGACLHKDDKDWTRRIGNERHLLCVEDPFELSHDLGRTVDRQTRAVLHKEFTRAATLLRDADDPLDQLFAPYRPGQRG